MTIFWILAAGLIGLALAFILTPLLRPPVETEPPPDQDAINLALFHQRLAELDADLSAGVLAQGRYDAARRDLERELLHDLAGGAAVLTAPGRASPLTRWLLGGVLVVAVPPAAVLLYLAIGEPQAVDRVAMPTHPTDASGEAASLEVLVQRLEARLAEAPSDLQGWIMLARTYLAIGRTQQGLQAIEKAYALDPQNSEVMLGYAEAIATTREDSSLAGRPAELIRAVLEREPENPSARWLAGMLSFQQGQFQAAAATWRRLLASIDPASEEAERLRDMVAQAEERAGMPATDTANSPAAAQTTTPAAKSAAAVTPPADAAPAAPAASAGPAAPSESAEPEPEPEPEPEAEAEAAPAAAAAITVTVTLDATLAAGTAPTDTVFIFARAAEGPPMPLAVKQLRVGDLPAQVELNDGMAMMPAMRLSAFPHVIVGARVSKSGLATPQSGDLEGQIGPVATQESGQLAVTIDRQRP